MDLFEAIRRRHTTNGAFADRPVDPQHKRAIFELAARAPSHFNSQPWRFVVVEDPERRRALGRVAGESMRDLMDDGRFFLQYRKFFRLSARRCRHQGRHPIDNIPGAAALANTLTERRVGMKPCACRTCLVATPPGRNLASAGHALARDSSPRADRAVHHDLLGAVIQTIWLADLVRHGLVRLDAAESRRWRW